MKLESQDRGKWISLLGGIAFFSGFSEEDLDRLLDAGEVGHYKFHEYVFKEGEIDFSFFVILKGKVKLIKRAAGVEKKEIGSLESGSCFGEMGLLLEDKRTAGALAAEESFIFKLNAKDVESMPESTQAKLFKRFAADLATKLKTTTEAVFRPTHTPFFSTRSSPGQAYAHFRIGAKGHAGRQIVIRNPPDFLAAGQKRHPVAQPGGDFPFYQKFFELFAACQIRRAQVIASSSGPEHSVRRQLGRVGHGPWSARLADGKDRKRFVEHSDVQRAFEGRLNHLFGRLFNSQGQPGMIQHRHRLAGKIEPLAQRRPVYHSVDVPDMLHRKIRGVQTGGFQGFSVYEHSHGFWLAGQ